MIVLSMRCQSVAEGSNPMYNMLPEQTQVVSKLPPPSPPRRVPSAPPSLPAAPDSVCTSAKPQTQTWRCVNTLIGHVNWVFSIAISPDGQTLASGSSDKTIKIWQLGTGKLLRTLTGHSQWVRSVAFSSDGQTLASSSRDMTIKIWRCD